MIFSRNLLKSQCYFYPISNQTGRPLTGSQVSEEGAGKVDAKYQGEGAREEVNIVLVLVNVLYFGGRQDWPCIILVDKKYQGKGAREEVWGDMGEARLDMYLFGL